MVALSTVKEYFSAYARGEADEVSNVIKNLLNLPSHARLYQKSEMFRQWTFEQNPSYTQYVTVEINDGVVIEYYSGGILRLSVQGVWSNYADGLESLSRTGIYVSLADYRTSKEAVEALCKKLIERFQKPSSQGNVKVFYDESEFLWCWKRPSSSAIVYNADRTKAYHAETCKSVVNILGEGIVPDERRFLNYEERSNIANGRNPEITIVQNNYYFDAALFPVYRNEIPFTELHRRVPSSTLDLYEFVLVNDERVYINLKKAENSLLATPIHGYSTRIEALVPANKLFLLGKTDLYAKRDKAEVPFLGWELEACSNLSAVGSQKSATTFKEHMPWLIMCKNDGSISPEGFETVSVPATLDFWQESNLSSCLDSMRVAPHNMRSFEHVKCGFHVHVSRSALSVLDLQKLERFIHNPENNNFIVTVAGRGAGRYQTYVPDLFNNRKKWSNINSSYFSNTRPSVLLRPSRVNEEDIMYFTDSLLKVNESANQRLLDLIPGANYRQRLVNMGMFFSEFVNYDHLDAIIRRNSEAIEKYLNFVNGYSLGDVVADLQRRDPLYLTEMCTGRDDPTNPDTHNELFRFLVQDVLCPGRPKFSALVKKFFPEWELVVEETVWKTSLRKSKAPFKRSLSHTASTIIKGPTGKGVNSRYDALNTTNKNTVEFRMFKGTMNGTTIMRYLEFVDAMIRFVADTNATNAGLHYTAFIKWLRDDPFNIARYEHLVSFITEKGFIDRKDIRKKTLPVIVSEDKDVEGLVAVPAKGFKELTEAKPVASITLSREQEEIEPAMSEEEANEQYDQSEFEQIEEDYNCPSCGGCTCGCGDCSCDH